MRGRKESHPAEVEDASFLIAPGALASTGDGELVAAAL
jgi:hypothetical protein